MQRNRAKNRIHACNPRQCHRSGGTRPKSIVDKAGLNTSDSRATLQKFLGLLLEGGSANLKQEAETLLKDPAESGIDWNAPLYVFEAPTLHNTAITLKIADLKKFEAILRLLAQEQLCTAPVEAGGYRSVEIKDAGVLLAYNDGTLLGVYGGSTEQLKKLQPAITALMQQPADKSIRTGKYFTPMMQQKETYACWQLPMPSPWMFAVY